MGLCLLHPNRDVALHGLVFGNGLEHRYMPLQHRVELQLKHHWCLRQIVALAPTRVQFTHKADRPVAQ